MATDASICNRALIAVGIQKVISSLAQDSAEAQACNQIYVPLRDALLRMAPWNCAFGEANLTYITSTPGTPENMSPQTQRWEVGQPAPPWAYEYQYPVDCLRACWIIPAVQTGYAGGVPITNAVTGGAPSMWLGAPARFKVQTDQFYPVTAATVVSSGSGHVVGDVITLASGASGSPPIGAPVCLLVASTGVGGAVSTVTVVNQVMDAVPPAGGSYFAVQTNPVAQGSTTGSGIGAAFNLTFGPRSYQRVILSNQEFATLAYIKRMTDPNVWDPSFQEAIVNNLAANIAMVLIGDKNLANMRIMQANAAIAEARKADANEDLTINDVTPDWIRARGLAWTDGYQSGPYTAFDWGGLLPVFF